MLIKTLILEGTTPRSWGEQHGEAYRAEIRELYQIRLALTLEKTAMSSEQDVLALAAAHMPLLEQFDSQIADEIRGLAAASDLSEAHVVLVNHYTDIRDIDRHPPPETEDPGGCSAFYVPASSGPVLGQTWDMHASATDFVTLIQLPSVPEGSDEAGKVLLFSLTGCVGMTGLTSWGMGMTINNLNSNDARVGVLWPALVRRCLREPTAAKGRDVIVEANLGSGHHYIVADGKDVYGIETSGQKKKVVQSGGTALHLHTNHALDSEMAETCWVYPGSSTRKRYQTMEDLGVHGFGDNAETIAKGLGRFCIPSPPPDQPHHVATCGSFVMDLNRREVFAGVGVPTDALPLGIRMS
jgi:isopenicillin-N N-acyltransferase like protein